MERVLEYCGTEQKLSIYYKSNDVRFALNDISVEGVYIKDEVIKLEFNDSDYLDLPLNGWEVKVPEENCLQFSRNGVEVSVFEEDGAID